MDPNANAVNSPVEQVAPTPAATPSTPTEELATPAAAEATEQATPVTNGLQLGDDIQKFLANQNIKSTDPSEIITTLVKRNQSLRSGKTDSQDVADVLSNKEEQVAPAPQTTTPAPASKLSDIEIQTVDMLVRNKFKDVSANADFYREMKESGFSPVSADGSINLNNVLNFANYKQKLADAQRAIDSAATPAVVPDPTNSVDTMATPVAQMTETAAQNIIMWSNQEQRYGRPRHSQYDEAVQFIQNIARNK